MLRVLCVFDFRVGQTMPRWGAMEGGRRCGHHGFLQEDSPAGETWTRTSVRSLNAVYVSLREINNIIYAGKCPLPFNTNMFSAPWFDCRYCRYVYWLLHLPCRTFFSFEFCLFCVWWSEKQSGASIGKRRRTSPRRWRRGRRARSGVQKSQRPPQRARHRAPSADVRVSKHIAHIQRKHTHVRVKTNYSSVLFFSRKLFVDMFFVVIKNKGVVFSYRICSYLIGFQVWCSGSTQRHGRASEGARGNGNRRRGSSQSADSPEGHHRQPR